MTLARARHSLALLLLASLVSPHAAAAQDTLARAKDLYVQAAYDEALAVLGRLRETASPPESSEVAGYEVLCLLALGRTDDARKGIESLVRADPTYRPSASTTSPRTRAMFDTVRRELLPQIAQEIYDKAKLAFDRKALQEAADGFERVLALLDEPGLTDLPNMADLRRLADGFRDLTKAAAATPPAPSPASTPGAPASAKPTPPVAPTPTAAEPARIYTADDTEVVPPTAVSRRTPTWQPRNEIEKHREFRGMIELVIGTAGEVTSAAIVKSIHPTYDRELLDRARTWKFLPATKAGVPVKYRMAIEILLSPRGD